MAFALSAALFMLPVASGLLASLSMPPGQPTPWLWIALVPLLLFLRWPCGRWRAFAGGWLAGAVYYLVLTYPFTTLIWWGWAQNAEEYAEAIRQQETFLAVFHPVTAAWGGVWWGLFSVALTSLSRSSRVRVWLAPALWIVGEQLSSASYFYYTWGWLGYGLHRYTVLRQLAAVTGMAGLGALIVLVNAWLAHGAAVGWTALRMRRFEAGTGSREALLAAGVAIAVFGAWGVAASYDRHAESPASLNLRVAALQAGERAYSRDDFKRGALDWAYTPLLDDALERGATLLVLPEGVWLAKLMLDATPIASTLSRHVGREEVREFLGSRLAPHSAIALVGFDVAEQGRIYNSIVAWDGDGIVGQYRKRRLTPFAEHAPGIWQWFAPEGRLVYTAGSGSQLIDAHGVRVGSFICQEAHFPGMIRESVRDGAQVLVSNGHDGIFRDPKVALAHHVAAQFRAIEMHRPLVRAMKTGVSSIVDSHGRAQKLSAMNKTASLLGEVLTSDYMTPYTRWGDWPVALALLGLLALVGTRIARRRTPAP